MPLPLVPVALLAAGAYSLWRGNEEKPFVVPGQAKGEPTGQVSELNRGSTYAVVVSVDPKAPPSPENLPAEIKSAFENLGWTVISPPSPRTEADRLAYQNRTGPSAWVFTGRWNLDAKYMTSGVPWIGMAQFTYLPVQVA